MVFASHEKIWNACIDVDIEEVIRLLQVYPSVLKDENFKQQLIDKITELEENSPMADMPFDSIGFKYNDLKVLLKGKIPLKRDLKSRDTLYAYLPHNTSAEKEEYKNQQEVHNQFFRVNRTLKERGYAEKLYREIQEAMKDGHTIVLDGKSARSIIIALTKVLSKNSKGHFPFQLKFRIGNTNLTCQRAVGQTERQKANFWLSVDELPNEFYQYGSSNNDSIGKKLIPITSGKKRENREIQLLELMRRKTVVIESFDKSEFNQHAQIRLSKELGVDEIHNFVGATKIRMEVAHQIHYLNGLNFLIGVIEVTRRLYRDNGQVYAYRDPKARESDAIPMSILQARASALVANGVASLKDLFGESAVYGPTIWKNEGNQWIMAGGSRLHCAQYGVATGKDTIENINVTLDKARKINLETESKIIRPLVGNGPDFFKSIPSFNSLGPSGMTFIEGKNRLKQNLAYQYGGNYESDGEDYSDDEESKNLGNLFSDRNGF